MSTVASCAFAAGSPSSAYASSRCSTAEVPSTSVSASARSTRTPTWRSGGGGSWSARASSPTAESDAPRANAARPASCRSAATSASPCGGTLRSCAATWLGAAPCARRTSRGARVPARALAVRELAVDGVADQGVDEAERRLGAQDLGARQRRVRGGELRVVDLGQRGDRLLAGVLSQHGDGARDGERLARQAGEPEQHGARDRGRADLPHEPGARRLRPHALGLERAQELAHEQRVAAGGGGDGVGERVGGVGAELGAHDRADRVARERIRAQRRGHLVAGDLRDEHRVGAGLGRARRDREQHRQALEPVREVGEEAQRRAVAPVQVVDGEHQRPVGGEVEQQPVEAVERGERRVALGGRGLQRREHGARRGRGARQRTLARRRLGELRLEQLPHHAERELPLELRGARGQRQRARRLAAAAERRQQAALPDPGRPLDQHRPALAAERAGELALERLDLPFALDQVGVVCRHVGCHAGATA